MEARIITVAGSINLPKANDQIIAICVRGPHKQSIPLVDLPRPLSLPHGWEWVEVYKLRDRQTGTSQFRDQ